jgi:Zn-dependent protease with chaperone function
MVTQSATKIGLRRVPTTFVHNSSGVMNAMAVRLFGGRYVWLTSALRDADTDSQVRFVLGHELGHHAFGHLDRWRNLLKLPGHFVPFLGVAYSRSRELSCDRMAAYMANDLDSSLSALQMLACGSARLNSQMNPAAFQDQERLIPPVTGFILNLFSGYLRITKRVASVANFFGTSYPASREGGFGNDGDNGRVLLGARSEPSLSAKT